MITFDRMMRNAISLHCQGKHHNAIISVGVFSGDWDLADQLGKRLGHTNNSQRIADSITKSNAILSRLSESRRPQEDQICQN